MKHLDLNLLRVFNLLYGERSAARAGDRLGVTQSAVSHALARLRKYFDDPLFIRSSSGLKPTPRAAELASVLEEIFDKLQVVLEPADFDPNTTRREFTIAAPLYLCELVMPHVIARARSEAPLARFRLWNTRNLAHSMDAGKVDIALGYFDVPPGRFRTQHLLNDRFVWIATPEVAVQPDLSSLESIAAFPRVMIAAMEEYLGVDEQVTEVGLRLQVVAGSDDALRHEGLQVAPAPISVYDAKIATSMVLANPIVGYVPRQVVSEHLRRGELIELNAPGPKSEFSISALWRNDADHDPGLQWLKAILMEIVTKLGES